MPSLPTDRPPRRPRPRVGVIFDIDGTLARSSSAHLDALALTAREHLDVDCTFDMSGETPTMNGVAVAGWVDNQCFLELAAQARTDWDTVQGAALVDYASHYQAALRAGAHPGELIAGCKDALAHLAEADVAMGLSTGNASAIAEAKLRALGIGDHFTFAPEAGFGDLHPHRSAVAAAAVRHLHDHAGTGLATIYLVGDTIADMTAATASGALGVGVLTGSATGRELLEAGAHVVLSDVAELPGFLGLSPSRWLPRSVPGTVSAADVWFDTH